MTVLKLGRLSEDRPVKVTIQMPAAVHRDLIQYGELLASETGESAPVDPSRLIAPMLARFMSTDRGFAKLRRGGSSQAG
jgi:hypothetical protein